LLLLFSFLSISFDYVKVGDFFRHSSLERGSVFVELVIRLLFIGIRLFLVILTCFLLLVLLLILSFVLILSFLKQSFLKIVFFSLDFRVFGHIHQGQHLLHLRNLIAF